MSRFCSFSLALGIASLAVLAFSHVPARADERPSALACAKADLLLMYLLADEHTASSGPPRQMAQAAFRMLEARAACRAGDYAKGMAFYTEALFGPYAEALAGPARPMERQP